MKRGNKILPAGCCRNDLMKLLGGILPLLKTCAACWFARFLSPGLEDFCHLGLVARAAYYPILMLEDDHGATMRLAKLEKISRVSMRPTLGLQLVDACQKLILSKFLLCGPGLFNYRRQNTSTERILLKVNTFTIVFASQKPHHSHQLSCFFEQATQTFWHRPWHADSSNQCASPGHGGWVFWPWWQLSHARRLVHDFPI